MLAFLINFLISFRDHFVLQILDQEPDNALSFALNLCKGIGILILGNLYDNVPKPKTLTFITLFCLAICTLLVSSTIISTILGFYNFILLLNFILFSKVFILCV